MSDTLRLRLALLDLITAVEQLRRLGVEIPESLSQAEDWALDLAVKPAPIVV